MIGFDNEKYLKLQSENIKKRIGKFDKLYLEFGGKLLDDYHAVRVLPGFKYDSKLQMLKQLKDDAEIIICISASDIERNKVRADYGITYDIEVMRLIDEIRKYELDINSVVVTLYENQPSADTFIKKLKQRGIKTYIHKKTKGYPTDVDTIVSDEGYGANPYIKTTKSLVVVTAPGPCSGKLATCLSQLYHEHKQGVKAGYSKFETFPVWNLPLKHPVNIAYEAATADLKDVNMIDYFHLEAYNETATNYNRDLEVFPVLKSILKKITNDDIYKSPTDMGVNMIGFCVTNDDALKEASCQEIIRRYYEALVSYKKGQVDEDVPERIKLLMNELNIDSSDRVVIKEALNKLEKTNQPSLAIKIEDKIITGKQTDLLSAPSSLFINSIKYLSNIPDEVNLLSPTVLESILKVKHLTSSRNKQLQLSEVLIALGICSATNPIIEKALTVLDKFENTEAHATYIVDANELKTLKSFKINITCEPVFVSNNLLEN